jgi:hypothetical protein
VNLGSRDSYGGGFTIADGRYIWKRLDVILFQPEGSRVPERLGVQLTISPHDDPARETQQFYSMGTRASEFFRPSQTGKGVVRIPGGSSSTLNNSTNWHMLLDSLWQSGMPEDYFSNNTSVLEGLDVYMQQVPEPDERKGFGVATGEAATERPDRKVAVVSEVYGAPWGNQKVAVVPSRAFIKQFPAKGTAAPPPPAAAAAEIDDESLTTAAASGMASFLEKNPRGALRLSLRTATHKYVVEKYGREMADTVISTFLDPGVEDNLAMILGQLGFKAEGSQIVPA